MVALLRSCNYLKRLKLFPFLTQVALLAIVSYIIMLLVNDHAQLYT